MIGRDALKSKKLGGGGRRCFKNLWQISTKKKTKFPKIGGKRLPPGPSRGRNTPDDSL